MYRQTLDQAGIREFAQSTLDYMESLVGATSGCFYLVDREGNAHSHVLHNLDRTAQSIYSSVYCKSDPLHPKRLMRSNQRIVHLAQVLHPSHLHRSDYFLNFLRPNRIASEIEVLLRKDDRIVAGISLHSDKVQSRPPEDCLKRLEDFSVYAEGMFRQHYCPETAWFAEPADTISSALTERELQIVGLLLEGKSNAAIAATANIAVPTVKTHVQHIFRKVSVKNRTELVATMLRAGTARNAM